VLTNFGAAGATGAVGAIGAIGAISAFCRFSTLVFGTNGELDPKNQLPSQP